MNFSDGPTHYGVFDVAFLSQLPQMPIYTPVTKATLRIAMEHALTADRAVAVRYSNGTENSRVLQEFYGDNQPDGIAIRNNFRNKGISCESLDGVIVTHGRIVCEALKATDLLAAKGMRIGILLLEQIAPYSQIAEQLAELLPRKSIPVLFLEEEIKRGGMGMLLSEALRSYSVMENKTPLVMALDDPFCTPGKGQNCYEAAGLDCESIAECLAAAVSRKAECLK
jgi:1-deoxy-D-xylulose-5-phosphate synthase